METGGSVEEEKEGKGEGVESSLFWYDCTEWKGHDKIINCKV